MIKERKEQIKNTYSLPNASNFTVFVDYMTLKDFDSFGFEDSIDIDVEEKEIWVCMCPPIPQSPIPYSTINTIHSESVRIAEYVLGFIYYEPIPPFESKLASLSLEIHNAILDDNYRERGLLTVFESGKESLN